LNSQERLEHFLKGIDAYILGSHIIPVKFNLECIIPETFDGVALDRLTQQECFESAYSLMQYADHIGTERAKTQNVIRWCEDSLQKIISQEIEDGEWSKYEKHEVKVGQILRNNHIANKINEWKMTAEGRMEHLQQRDYNVRRKADILMEKGKRK
jgi:hypothetical protein